MNGKGAMVWQIRNWASGKPESQVAEAIDLGLDHVSLKVLDGRNEKWESIWTKNQNYELLPELVPALLEAGIQVKGWGWTYGNAPEGEADATIAVCRKYGLEEYDIDAENQYNKASMENATQRYVSRIAGAVPEIRLGLCSYRFPLTYQPNFPVRQFAVYIDFWDPQVYFLGDNRVDGGAIQLEQSFNELKRVRVLPFCGVAPTYDWNGWRATKEQLRRFFQKALDLGHEGFMVWDLPQASLEQKQAIREFVWDDQPTQPITVNREIVVPSNAEKIIITINRED